MFSRGRLAAFRKQRGGHDPRVTGPCLNDDLPPQETLQALRIADLKTSSCVLPLIYVRT